MGYWPGHRSTPLIATCLFASSASAHWVSFHYISSLIHFSMVQSTRCQFLCSPALPTRLQLACICTAHSFLISPTAAKPSLLSSGTCVAIANLLRCLPK
jgi:hypothetical protein